MHLDLNNSAVPMTDKNGSYISVIGKCNNYYSFAIFRIVVELAQLGQLSNKLLL